MFSGSLVSPQALEAHPQRRWWAVGVLCCSLAVIGIDNTILNVALPTLVRDLNATTADLQWIVDAYTLVFAGTLLTAGSLGDRFGRRGALSIGLAIFGGASLAASFATDAMTLTLARAVMGIGAALIMPATLSIITNTFIDPRERGRAIGVWAGVSAIGIAIGPILGGFLLEHFWWGSVFLVNVPVAIIALILGRFLVPTSKDPSASKLDPLGSVLSIVGLSVVLWAIIEGPEKGWSDPTVVGAFVVGLVVLGAFTLWELHSDHPMLDLTFFKRPRFTIASLSITMTFFALSGTMFLLTQYLQFVLGYDALAAGYRMAPIAVVMMTVAPQSPKLAERFGTKRMVVTGFGVSALGLLILAACDADSSYALMFVGLIVLALGFALGMAPATESIMGSLPREKAGVGSAVNDTTRQMGGALGVAVLGSILASGYRAALDADAAGVALRPGQLNEARSSLGGALQVAGSLGSRAGDTLITTAREAFSSGMRVSLIVGAVFVIAGAILSWKYLPARAEHHELNATETLPVDIVIDDAQFPTPAIAE
jgi:EmrB/QacA subfamily drug resistance transporter